jgi:hypothetical protein
VGGAVSDARHDEPDCLDDAPPEPGDDGGGAGNAGAEPLSLF